APAQAERFLPPGSRPTWLSPPATWLSPTHLALAHLALAPTSTWLSPPPPPGSRPHLALALPPRSCPLESCRPHSAKVAAKLAGTCGQLLLHFAAIDKGPFRECVSFMPRFPILLY